MYQTLLTAQVSFICLTADSNPIGLLGLAQRIGLVGFLAIMLYIMYRKEEALNKQKDELQKKIFELEKEFIKISAESKKVIEENKKVIESFISKTGSSDATTKP